MSSSNHSDEYWMTRALGLAERGKAIGEVPVGAVLVLEGQVVGEGWNRPISARDPTAHAEIIALRHAAERLQNYRLPGTCLYVTLEPCTMCVGALVHARIERLVYGATEPKAGVVESQGRLLESEYYNHRISCQGGVMGSECQHQLSEFFRQRRALIKAQKQAAKL